jgi:hypothetical protein
VSTRKDGTSPTDADPPSIVGFLKRITAAVEAIAHALATPKGIDPEARCLTAAEAAEVLGVTENWVMERMDEQSIPFTYVGKFRRMRMKHIRAVAEANEIDPNHRGRIPRPRAAA